MASRLRDEGMDIMPRHFSSGMSTKVESCRWKSPAGGGGSGVNQSAVMVGAHCVCRALDGFIWQVKGRTL